MTDRLNGLTIVLEQDIREDDAEYLINAIKMLRGVASVEPNVSNIDSHIAYERAKVELKRKLYDALD